MEFNGTFFAAIISFLVFVFIMNQILYKPVRKIVNERNSLVDGNYKAADDNNSQAEKLNSEHEEKLSEAKENARGKYNTILDGFKSKRTGIIEKAREESKDELEKAYSDLDNASNQTKEGLKQKMTGIADDIVEKILGYHSEVQGFNNDKINEILYQKKG